MYYIIKMLIYQNGCNFSHILVYDHNTDKFNKYLDFEQIVIF